MSADNDAYQELPAQWSFTDPPPSGRVSRVDFAALLANPGRWVQTHHTYASASTSMRKAAEKKHGGRWESCNRPAEVKGQRKVFLRYLGGSKDQPATASQPPSVAS